MVLKASEDLPDPDRPVMTTSRSRGRSTSIFFRLWTRAPRTAIQSWAIPTAWNFWKNPTSDFSTRTRSRADEPPPQRPPTMHWVDVANRDDHRALELAEAKTCRTESR